RAAPPVRTRRSRTAPSPASGRNPPRPGSRTLGPGAATAAATAGRARPGDPSRDTEWAPCASGSRDRDDGGRRSVRRTLARSVAFGSWEAPERNANPAERETRTSPGARGLERGRRTPRRRNGRVRRRAPRRLRPRSREASTAPRTVAKAARSPVVPAGRPLPLAPRPTRRPRAREGHLLDPRPTHSTAALPGRPRRSSFRRDPAATLLRQGATGRTDTRRCAPGSHR